MFSEIGVVSIFGLGSPCFVASSTPLPFCPDLVKATHGSSWSMNEGLQGGSWCTVGKKTMAGFAFCAQQTR